jgi:hypothetical protein
MRQGKVGDAVDSALDNGLIFYKAGETVNRDVAWFTSYRNWRSANPGAEFNAKAKIQVLANADDLAGQMSRASKAAWNEGALSLPTQFLSWQARQLDRLTGKELNGYQKARLFTANTLMYGIPTGAIGTLVAPIWPMGDTITKTLNENGYNTDDAKVRALTDGILQGVLKQALGQDYAVKEKFGTDGTSIIKDYMTDKKGLIETLAGPSGSIIKNMFKGAGSIYGAAADQTDNLLKGRPADPTLLRQELALMARDVKSVDSVYGLMVGLAANKLYTKSGDVMDVSTQEVWVKFFSGMNSQRVQDLYSNRGSLIDLKKKQDSIEKDILNDLDKMYNNLGNPELANQYQARALIKLEMGQFDSRQRQQILNRGLMGSADAIINTNMQFAKKFPAAAAKADKTILEYEQMKKDK